MKVSPPVTVSALVILKDIMFDVRSAASVCSQV